MESVVLILLGLLSVAGIVLGILNLRRLAVWEREGGGRAYHMGMGGHLDVILYSDNKELSPEEKAAAIIEAVEEVLTVEKFGPPGISTKVRYDA